MKRRPVLLDSSAVLAMLQQEPGGERVEAFLDSSSIHSVNAYEVLRKLIRKGMPPDKAVALFRSLELDIIEELSFEQIAGSSELLQDVRQWGLSLGDCVCLLTGRWFQSTIVTADTGWKPIADRFTLEFIR